MYKKFNLSQLPISILEILECYIESDSQGHSILYENALLINIESIHVGYTQCNVFLYIENATFITLTSKFALTYYYLSLSG